MWQCGSDFHSASRHERRSNYRLRYVNIATCQSTERTKWLFVQLGVYVSSPFPGTVTPNAQGGHKPKSQSATPKMFLSRTKAPNAWGLCGLGSNELLHRGFEPHSSFLFLLYFLANSRSNLRRAWFPSVGIMSKVWTLRSHSAKKCRGLERSLYKIIWSYFIILCAAIAQSV
jgi:hypothetical protein